MSDRGNTRKRTTRVWAFAIAALLVTALTSSRASETTAPAPSLAPLFAELHGLETPHYTGGLPSRNRALAARIRAAMLPQFPQLPCPPDGSGGVLWGYAEDKALAKPSLNGLDPNLIELLKALDDTRQEVRDTAAYTIGLLGPSAKGAVPFLQRLFAGDSEPAAKRKGNWTNDAFGKLICENIIAADFRAVIPDELLPPQEPWGEFLRKSAVLMATLYLDEDIEYPPGMMAYAYSNYAITDHADDAAPLFAKILSNDKLSLQKHVEVAEILMRVPSKVAKPSLSALLRLTGSTDRELRFNVTEALFDLRHEAAIPLLVERIGTMNHWGWQKLCVYGAAARSAEAPLLAVLADTKRWPRDIRAAVEVLGCIKSRKAVPVILGMLPFPDWVMQRDIASALGDIGDRSLVVQNTLTALATKHWSKRVRSAAEEALLKLNGAPPPQPDPMPQKVLVSIGGSFPIDHGLPWCDTSGKYSIDGSTWFSIAWQEKSKEEIPADFPLRDKVADSARQFMRVDDGWLFGADIGEFGGGLWYVSRDGKATELELREHTNIYGILRTKDGIFAFARQIAINGDSGVLLKLTRGPDGIWKSTRVGTLPSVPWMFATSPDGELLLSDEANTYAVINGDIVPLRCEKVHPGSYFTDHGTYQDPD